MEDEKELEKELKIYKNMLEEDIDAGKIAWWEMELPSGEVDFNDRKVEMLGYSPERFEHYTDFTDLLHPEDHDRAMKAMRDYLEGRESRYEVEYRIRKENGEYKWLRDLGGITEEDENSEYKKVTGIVIDIDDRKRAEEEIKHRESLERIITEVSTGFVNTEIEKIDEKIDQALKKIGEFAGADRSRVFQFDEDLEKLDMAYEWCDEDVEPKKDMMESLSSDAHPWLIEKLKNFENLTISKVSELPPEAEAFEEVLQEQNIKSLLVVPLISNDELQGVIGFNWVKKEKEWSEEVIDLLKIAGETIQSALDRKEREKELRESKQRLDLALEGAELVVWDWNIKTDEIKYDVRWGDVLGYRLDEIEHNFDYWEDQIHPDDLPKIKDELEKHLEGETELYRTEQRMETKSGDWVWVKSVGKVFERDEDGNPVRAVGIHEDITDRKKAEKKLEERERFLDSILTAVQDGISVLDTDLNIQFTNDIMKEWYAENAPLEGKKCFKCYHNRDEPCDPCPTVRCLETGKTEREVVPGLPGSDAEWLELYSFPMKDEETEEIEGVVEFVRDVTERKQARDRIEQNKQKIERLHKISSELETCQSEEEVFRLAIKAMEDILDFDRCSFSKVEEDKFMVKESSSDLTKEDYLERPIEEGGIDTKTYLNQESYLIKNINKSEDAKPVNSQYKSAVSVPIGEYGVLQAVATEIDYFDEEDLKMAKLLTRHMTEALKRLETEEREEFLHSLLRHDVANKNRVIKGYLDLLKDYDLPDEVKNLMDKMEQAAEANKELIEKVRKLRKIKEEDEIGKTDLNPMINKSVSKHKNLLQDKGMKIDVDEVEGKVRGGPLLEELFCNLIENSIQHSKCEEIKISTRIEEDECLVTVEDDVTGIPDEKKDKIFDKGFKDRETAGTGLGLYLVKEIAENYGGNVEVKDSELGGARFEIRLQRIR